MKRLVLIGLVVASFIPCRAVSQQVQYAEVNGTTLAYRAVGQGQPLLLLHGFGESGRVWDPLLEALSEHYRLIVPDLRGHGSSARLTGEFTHREAATDMLELLDELGIGSSRAVGFSTGAMTLLHVATTAPTRLSAMVLVGGAPYLPRSAREIMRGMDPEGIPMIQLEQQGLVHGDTARARQLLRQFVGFQDSYTDVSFTPPFLSSIEVPTLVVHGDRDPFFPITIATELHEAMPESFLLVFPNLGHQPFPSEAAARDYFVHSVLSFFDGAWF